jgi:hypothetical protein
VIAAPMNKPPKATESHELRPVQFMAAIFVALGYHVRVGIRTASDLIERRFAEFAGVPNQGPLSRQQWEALWETEKSGPFSRYAACPLAGGDRASWQIGILVKGPTSKPHYCTARIRGTGVEYFCQIAATGICLLNQCSGKGRCAQPLASSPH